MTPEQFREAHRALGWTTVRLAAFLGVTTRTVQMWENGRTSIPPLVSRVMQAIMDGRLEPKELEL